MSRATGVLVAALLVSSGCSMFQGDRPKFRPVSEADYGRLGPDQLGPVTAARDAVFAARDEIARAKLRLQEAENEAELARADEAAAKAAQQRARAELNAAAESNAPEEKAHAQEVAAQAELQSRSARGHLAYANQLGRGRQAEVEAAEALLKLREAELEQARVEALRQADIPAATKYDAATFAARVADAQKSWLEAQSRAKVRLADADRAENDWRTLHAQYQERVQSQSAATGSGAVPQQPAEGAEQPPAPAPQAPPAPRAGAETKEP